MRYIALIRGINVSGKNKVSMPELRSALGGLGFEDVATLLNSGNVAFSTDEGDDRVLSRLISEKIRGHFGVDVPVYVAQQKALEQILLNEPDWWGSNDRAAYDNLIFAIPPLTVGEVCAALGEPNVDLERIKCFRNVIFRTFDLSNYRKTNRWAKTASSDIRDGITIRTANTVRRLVLL